MKDPFGYSGKVATVTGGASGIGEAVVRRLVAAGAKVVATDINAERLAKLGDELGPNCITMHADATLEKNAEAMVRKAVDGFGGLDAAFNIAGTTRMGAITDLSEEDWRFSLDLCLTGVFFAMKHAARQMISGGARGAIVNIASLNSVVPGWGMSAYCASKAGLEMLSKTGALEMSVHGIRVNTVSPGLTATPAANALTSDMLEKFMERIPMKRSGSADDQADACLFLGSDLAGYITGINLIVDGGWAVTGYPDMEPFYGRDRDPRWAPQSV